MTRRWCQAPQVLTRRLPDGVMLCATSGDADEPISLLGTGAALWAELDEPSTLDELAARLAERFEADPAQVARDLEPTVRELEVRHLVVVDP